MRRAEYTHTEEGACEPLRRLTPGDDPWRGAWLPYTGEAPAVCRLCGVAHVVTEGDPEWPESPAEAPNTSYPDKDALSTQAYRERREAELNRPTLEERLAALEAEVEQLKAR